MRSGIGRTPKRKYSLLSSTVQCNLSRAQNCRDFPGGRVRKFEIREYKTSVTDNRCFRWVRTGDEVEFDTEGNIYVVDRLKVKFAITCWKQSLTYIASISRS